MTKALSDVKSSTFALRGKDDKTSFDDTIQLLHLNVPFTFSLSTEKFREKASSISKRDIERIEHNIRFGEKYVKQLNMKGVVGVKRA